MWALVSVWACSGGGPDGSNDAGSTDTSEPSDTDTLGPWDPDGDGFAGVGDCDENDPTVHYGAPELCDGKDNDCDGVAESDEDHDGFLDCEECDDDDPALYPGAPDPLDGLDTNCDGTDGVAEPPDVVLSGTTPCGELGSSMDVLDVDADGVDELIAGAPRSVDCGDAWAEAVVLSAQGTVDTVRGRFSDGLAGWRVEGFDAGGPRAAVLHFGWGPDGVVEVYAVDGSGFGAEPVLHVEGTGPYYLGEVSPVGDPPTWLAITSIASSLQSEPTAVWLFAADQAGEALVDEAPAMIGSSNLHFATGQWIEDVGDRDGDGLHELGVGARYGDGPDPLSRAYIVTPGVDTALEQGLETWWGSEPWLDTAASMRAGDLTGDGTPELCIPSHYAYEGRGTVHVLDWLGPGDHEVFTEAMAEVVGEAPGDVTRDAAVADADGDGWADLAVGAQQDPFGSAPGKVMLFLGPVSGVLTRADADRVWSGTDPGSRFGYELAVGDFDGNGVPDLAVGAPAQDDGLVEDVGAVHFLFDYGLGP